ncbi:MAG: hypothetical protein OXE56_01310, partial [Gammaproteobacteria bacterium]|nr:hypothetical protein [Gammaproteobacteria bacterium]
ARAETGMQGRDHQDTSCLYFVGLQCFWSNQQRKTETANGFRVCSLWPCRTCGLRCSLQYIGLLA